MVIRLEDNEFYKIINDILNNQEFLKLKEEFHHGISRYTHSLNVAKISYYLSKFLKLDYERITRAALLHDFYLDQELKNYNKIQTLVKHPLYASSNASLYFDIDNVSKNIIESHMFPLCKVMPKYKESLLVSFADKLAASKEMSCYKITTTCSIWILFIINMITVKMS